MKLPSRKRRFPDWVDCFEKAELVDTLFCGGLTGTGEAGQHPDMLEKAYEFGRRLK